MKEYRVEVVWGDRTQDSHLIRATSDAAAIAGARVLVEHMNRECPSAAQAKLQAIYNSRGECVWSA